MYNSALYGFVIWCVGCVIPTPLDVAPKPTNYNPVFVTSRVSPAFGKASELTTSGITFSLAATDPNHDDMLEVRLFQPDSTGTLIYFGAKTTLMIPSPPDPDDPNLRLGTLDAAPCLNVPDQTTLPIFAVVADRAFTGKTPAVDGGLTDTNHWELTCTSM